jgi:beta-glucosidase
LKVKFELSLFDDPYKYCDENRELTTVGKPEFQEVVLDMAKNRLFSLKRQGFAST